MSARLSCKVVTWDPHGTLVAESRSASAKLSEVLGSLWDDIVVEFEGDSASRLVGCIGGTEE